MRLPHIDPTLINCPASVQTRTHPHTHPPVLLIPAPPLLSAQLSFPSSSYRSSTVVLKLSTTKLSGSRFFRFIYFLFKLRHIFFLTSDKVVTCVDFHNRMGRWCPVGPPSSSGSVRLASQKPPLVSHLPFGLSLLITEF